MEPKLKSKRKQLLTSSLEDPGPSLEEVRKESLAVNSARVLMTLTTMALSRRKTRMLNRGTRATLLPMELGNSSTWVPQPKLVEGEILRRRRRQIEHLVSSQLSVES